MQKSQITPFVAPQDSAVYAEHVAFSYSTKKRDKNKVYALSDVSLDIKRGEFVAIVGHTGSGKSTFLQHFNALVRLQNGNMSVLGIDLSAKKPDLKALRRQVGMVFQYPEYQLFADTVYDDVCFGLKNFDIPAEKHEELARNALFTVGMNFDEVRNKSPFDLSGGEKRRVALAGVLVTNPSLLVLDEPTAGLDPNGKREILSLVRHLNKQNGVTVVMVSHDMNEVYENANRVIVFSGGSVAYDLPTRALFRKEEEITALGLEVPHMARFCNVLEAAGYALPDDALSVDDVFAAVCALKSGSDKGGDEHVS